MLMQMELSVNSLFNIMIFCSNYTKIAIEKLIIVNMFKLHSCSHNGLPNYNFAQFYFSFFTYTNTIQYKYNYKLSNLCMDVHFHQSCPSINCSPILPTNPRYTTSIKEGRTQKIPHDSSGPTNCEHQSFKWRNILIQPAADRPTGQIIDHKMKGWGGEEKGCS